MNNPCAFCSLEATTLKTEARPACAGHGDVAPPKAPARITIEACDRAIDVLEDAKADLEAAKRRATSSHELRGLVTDAIKLIDVRARTSLPIPGHPSAITVGLEPWALELRGLLSTLERELGGGATIIPIADRELGELL